MPQLLYNSRFAAKAVAICLLTVGPAAAQYIGAAACRPCHLSQFEAQSKTAHHRALSRSGNISNFGSGMQAVTPVSRVNEDFYKEHGLTRYTLTRREAITPGHKNTNGVQYRIFDPGGQIFRC